jgi:hypothetical protein
MLWVDHNNYIGPDRRGQRSRLRLTERRREHAVGQPPALGTALRQLRLRVLDAKGAAGLAAFSARASAVALLANARGRRPVADILMRLARRLLASPFARGDLRPMIYAELDRAEALTD